MDLESIQNTIAVHLTELLNVSTSLGCDVKVIWTEMKKLRICLYSKKLLEDFSDMFEMYLNFHMVYFDPFFRDNPRVHKFIRESVHLFAILVKELTGRTELTEVLLPVILKHAKSRPNSPCIKEFLRMFTLLLRRAKPEVLKKISTFYELFDFCFELIDECHIDIELQAIVIEMLWIVFRNSPNSRYLTRKNSTLSEVLLDEKQSFSYKTIRCCLNAINEDSSSLFSIQCDRIGLNSRAVLEYPSNKNAKIWLDFDLVDKKISFFTCQDFLHDLMSVAYKTATCWLYLSFYVSDLKDATFNNDLSSGLEMQFTLSNNSSFNIFSRTPPKLYTLTISISKHAPAFKKLVGNILPKIMNDSSFFNTLNITNGNMATLKGFGSGNSSPEVLSSDSDAESSDCSVEFIKNKPQIKLRQMSELLALPETSRLNPRKRKRNAKSDNCIVKCKSTMKLRRNESESSSSSDEECETKFNLNLVKIENEDDNLREFCESLMASVVSLVNRYRPKQIPKDFIMSLLNALEK